MLLGCISLYFDAEIYDATLKFQMPLPKRILTLFFLSYNPIFLFTTLSIFTVIYRLKKKTMPQKSLLDLCKSLFLVIAFTTLLKITIGRARPFLNNGSFNFLPFSFQNSHYSLPSSHAAAAYTLFGTSSFFFILVTVVLSVLRVIFLHHFISDIFFGWALAEGIQCLKIADKEKQGCKKC